MATNKTNTAPLAVQAAKDVTDTMQSFSDWLTEQTGYKVDPRSVQLGSALRGVWQAEQRAAKDASKPKRATKALVKAAPKPVAVKPMPKPRVTKGVTLATPEGVVIAEQRHVEVA